jgi:hypothetical protein
MNHHHHQQQQCYNTYGAFTLNVMLRSVLNKNLGGTQC